MILWKLTKIHLRKIFDHDKHQGDTRISIYKINPPRDLCGEMLLTTRNTKDAQGTLRDQLIEIIPLGPL